MKKTVHFLLLIVTAVFFAVSCASSPPPETPAIETPVPVPPVPSADNIKPDPTDTAEYSEKVKAALNDALAMKKTVAEYGADTLYPHEYTSAEERIQSGMGYETADKERALKNYEQAAALYQVLINLTQAYKNRSIILEHQYEKKFPHEYAEAEKLYEKARDICKGSPFAAVQKSNQCLFLYKKIIDENTAVLAQKAIQAAERAEEEARNYALQLDRGLLLYDESICVDEPEKELRYRSSLE